jgi:MarR family transcriptional regulator, 2-MHQ and catechol-resistance regulon repressor
VGTRYLGTPEEIQALNVYIAISRAQETIRMKIHRCLRAHDLTERQFAILEALFHLGPLTQREIAAKMLVTPGNITAVVDKLEDLAFVTRQEIPRDRRCHLLVLTEKGVLLVKKILPLHVREITVAMSHLDSTEQQALRTLCRKLGLANIEKT